MTEVTLHQGDVLDVLPGLGAEAFDACLCDPPYGLRFMGRAWDHGVPGEPVWREVLRVLRPGAFVFAFGGTRTFHRLAVGIEDAGAEIRDSILAACWVYSSGFPKSLDISKAIDRQRYDREEILEVTAWIAEARDKAELANADIDAAFGFNGMAGHWTSQKSQPAVPTLEQVPKLMRVLKLEEREVPGRIVRLLFELNGRKGEPGPDWWKREVVGTRVKALPSYGAGLGAKTKRQRWNLTAPATEDAHRWNGWGSALKPAWEPVVVGMKPLDGTFANNALAHGVAGLNIDGCRIGTEERLGRPTGKHAFGLLNDDAWVPADQEPKEPGGRYPSNFVLSHHPGCRRTGNREVSSSLPGTSVRRQASPSIKGAGKGRVGSTQPKTGYADPDGTETVPAYDCHPACPVAALDRASGERKAGSPVAGTEPSRPGKNVYGKRGRVAFEPHADFGTASRFYFQAEWERADFEALLYRAKADTTEREIGMAPGERCMHPTLKPIALCAYLAKLLLPPPRKDGQPRRLLVPFAGAGSEIIGACRAGWDEVVGVEIDDASVTDAEARIRGDSPLLVQVKNSRGRLRDGKV